MIEPKHYSWAGFAGNKTDVTCSICSTIIKASSQTDRYYSFGVTDNGNEIRLYLTPINGWGDMSGPVEFYYLCRVCYSVFVA